VQLLDAKRVPDAEIPAANKVKESAKAPPQASSAKSSKKAAAKEPIVAEPMLA